MDGADGRCVVGAGAGVGGGHAQADAGVVQGPEVDVLHSCCSFVRATLNGEAWLVGLIERLPCGRTPSIAEIAAGITLQG